MSNDDAASLLASATDLLNTWARESGVTEARNESEIKQVIDRLWSDTSSEQSCLISALHVARGRMAHFTLDESIQVDAALGRKPYD